MSLELINKLPYDHPYRWDGRKFGGYKLWQPSEISTHLWYDANFLSSITESGGKISEWADRSGNGINATQGTAVQQPTLLTKGINFTNQYLTTAPNSPVGDYTLYAALKTNALETTAVIIGHFTNRVYLGFSSVTGEFSAGAGTQTWDSAPSSVASGVGIEAIHGATLDSSGTYKIFINSVEDGGNSLTGGLYGGSRFAIGSDTSASFTLQNTDIYEIIVTTNVETTAIRQKIEGYLAWKWDLVSKLSVGHPYKSQPPRA
jgi:hypothetical protein